MADNEKTTLATFNVGSDDWESFKTLAKKDGRPASYYLNQFIKQSISRGSFETIASESKPIFDIDLSGVETVMTEKINQAIAALLTKTEFESAKEDIWAELTRLDSAVAMVGNYYEFTGNEEFFNQQENAAPVNYFPDAEEAIADPKSQPLN
jgi:hypothetical protein